MAFSNDDHMQQSKLNFFNVHDAINAHNSQPGVTYKQGLNKFSILLEFKSENQNTN